MVICISPQKAGSVAKKFDVELPPHGEEYLVGRVGGKLGCFSDPQPGTKYYIKLYGDTFAITRGHKEFNLKTT
jgi:hypothetical protein